MWRGEVRTAAIAAAGGLVAGAATVAVVRASRGSGSRRPARAARQGAPARSSRAVRSWSTSTCSAASSPCRCPAARGRGAAAVDVPPTARLGGDGTARLRWGVSRARGGRRPGRRPRLAAGGRARRLPRAAGADDCPAAALELAIERMRFAIGVDDDLTSSPHVSRRPADRRRDYHRPWQRPKRRPWPWEALAWAVTEQLIEARRAAEIQRRIVRRWGARLEPRDESAWRGPGPLRECPRRR